MKKNKPGEFKVPPAMKRKWSETQQRIFIDACESNYYVKEFLQKEQTLSDEEYSVIIHNIVFNTVSLIK